MGGGGGGGGWERIQILEPFILHNLKQSKTLFHMAFFCVLGINHDIQPFPAISCRTLKSKLISPPLEKALDSTFVPGGRFHKNDFSRNLLGGASHQFCKILIISAYLNG